MNLTNVYTYEDLKMELREQIKLYLSETLEIEDEQEREEEQDRAMDDLVYNDTIYTSDVLTLLNCFVWNGDIDLNELQELSMHDLVSENLAELVYALTGEIE